MPRQAYATQLRDHLGNEVRLAPKPFAVGGEGAVFDVQGQPNLVAKLYNKPQSRERCDKLRAMAKLCGPDLLKIAAWPTATLSTGNGAAIDGILMPRIAGYLEIHHLYSVAQRKKDFPEADWGFLLHTARNCAIAFEAVHAHGHVVGDVNQKNVMVSKRRASSPSSTATRSRSPRARGSSAAGWASPNIRRPSCTGRTSRPSTEPRTTTCSGSPC